MNSNKYYVSGVRENAQHNCERCDDALAQFWTVYVRDAEDFSHAVCDCNSSRTAEIVSDSLNSNTAPAAAASVLAEMDRQDRKWGANRDHSPVVWHAILSEEVGELARAILHDGFGGSHAGTTRAEAVQVAAVALQIIEYYDRNNQ